MTFLEFLFALFTPKVRIIHENSTIFFSFKNEHFTLPFSCSSSIYNIDTAINTSTTMNNQFKALKTPKNRFSLFLSHLLCTKTITFTFSLYSSKKKTKILILNFLKVHRAIQAQDSWSSTSGSLSGDHHGSSLLENPYIPYQCMDISKIHTSLISVCTSISRAQNFCVLEEANWNTKTEPFLLSN